MTEHFEKQKILSLFKNESLKQTIKDLLKSEGIPHHTPCLKIEILNQASNSFLIEKSDIFKVFSHFGEIKEIRVLRGIALVLYRELTSAYLAQKIFNEKEIPEMGIVLKVNWYYNQDENQESRENSEDFTDNSQKFTIRFDIQIENDKEFQVARRLIGPKGINMKNIVEKCCKGMTGPVHDVIKLRLRGKGSGFKEGPDQIESSEALHICISSKFNEKLNVATEEIEKLITHVYHEYREYRNKKGMNDIKMHIKKSFLNTFGEGFEDENFFADEFKIKNTGKKINFLGPQRKALSERHN